MKLLQGDFLSDGDAKLFVAPCSSSLKRVGATHRLVMGAGAAKVMAQRFNCAPDLLGKLVEESSYIDEPVYGFVKTELGDMDDDFMLGAFQSKVSFKSKSNLALIGFSAWTMDTVLRQTWNRKLGIVSMAMPGIGLGGLQDKFDAIKDILSILPDYVRVYYLPF